MPEILLVSRDLNLISTMQIACSKTAISLSLCSEVKNALALLKARKFYAVLVDDTDQVTTTEFLTAIRKSSSSEKAMSIVFAEGPTTAATHAALVVAKPVSMELALRTLRAAQGPMSSEFHRYVRHSLRIPIKLTTESKQEIQAILVNISDGGLAVQFARQQQVAAATIINAHFVLPGTGDWVQVNGEVVWCDAEGKAGLRCGGVTKNDRERLRKWLSTQVVNAR